MNSSPKVRVDNRQLQTTSAKAPKKPHATVTRRSVLTVRAIRWLSLAPTASAIWRTPLKFSPIPAINRVTSKIEL